MEELYVREPLPASCLIARVWFLPRVCSNVYRQCASLNELLAAILGGAGVRSFVGMYSVMPLKVGFAIEALLVTH